MTTRDLADGESVEMKGSGARPYVLKNTGGVYSCSCPAWRNQSVGIERRTCKHLRRLRGDAAEDERCGTTGTGGGGANSANSAAQATSRSRSRAARSGAGARGSTAGAKATEPPLLLAHSWQNNVDLAGWWMSEKLDGVRAYWDGKRFLSRLGNEFLAPDWFTAGLPDIPLDGELFAGRKLFQRTVSIVRRMDRSKEWQQVRFVVFDAPAHDGAFEERLAQVTHMIGEDRLPHASAHPHEPCHGVDHLRQELARVEGLGGEGLMLRKPGSRYEVGRSYTLLKVKSFKDEEARVIGHVPGAGRHKGRLGALSVRLQSGVTFSVGTGLSDKERDNPPPIGAVITFRYQELSRDGVPRFPSYVGERHDVAFDDGPEDPPARARKPPRSRQRPR